MTVSPTASSTMLCPPLTSTVAYGKPGLGCGRLGLAVDETAILLHPPLPLAGVSIVIERESVSRMTELSPMAKADRAAVDPAAAGWDGSAGRRVTWRQNHRETITVVWYEWDLRTHKSHPESVWQGMAAPAGREG